jgi:hypothetical protein
LQSGFVITAQELKQQRFRASLIDSGAQIHPAREYEAEQGLDYRSR